MDTEQKQEPLGMYFTPPHISQIIDPAIGTGGFLKSALDLVDLLFSNPPYETHGA